MPIVFILTLSSCGKLPLKAVQPKFVSESEITVQYLQSEFTAKISTDEKMNMTAEIQQPDDLSGITVECSENGMKAKCGNVVINSSDGYLPFAELYKVIRCINASNPVSTDKSDESYTFIYKNNDEQYTVNTDLTGTIKYIITPMCEFEKR